MHDRIIRGPLGILAAISLVASPGCGGDGRSGGGGDDDAAATDPAAAETAENAAAADAGKTETVSGPLEFTADYKLRPVDVIIIRDSPSRDVPVTQRLSDAVPTLASKLWNLASTVGSVHVGVVDTVSFEQDGKLKAVTTTPLVDQDHKDLPALFGETLPAAEFAAALKKRVDMAGSRPGASMPATILAALIAEAKKPEGSTLPGLFRPDAYWSILYVGQTANPLDPLDDRDVVESLKDRIGSVSISALVPDKAGCVIADTTPEQRTVPEGTFQRNLEIKLQEGTGGVVGSICSSEFVTFMDQFVNGATGTAYFPVTLPKAVQASTIKITAAGVDVKEFRYQTGSTVLEVSTKIKPGTKFTVTATPEGEKAEVVVGTDPGDDVPKPGADKLPPDQEAFLKDIQPVLQRNCGGCHGGRPFSTNGGFASAKAYKSDIARRIALPEADAQRMPPKPAMLPAADLEVLANWAKP